MGAVYFLRPARFLIFLLGLLPFVLFGQTTSQTSFGKNRIQYHQGFDDWLVYETPNLVTYWYGEARNVAQSALQTAEYDFPVLQQLLEHQPIEKIEMLVFSDLSDLKQSNIGEEDVFLLRSGETKVLGNKLFVYFDGNHHHLRTQIREGMAGVLLNSMLFGANIQEIVQNAVLLNLPGWYTNGLTAYCGEEWSVELDNQLRDVLLNRKFKNFDRFAKEYPRLAGHAFWYYISTHFGRSTISNLLYLTRINRSVDAGFLYVLGNGYRRTMEALMEFYQKRYRDDAQITQNPDEKGKITFKNKKQLPLSQIKISPDGRRVIWVTNDIGRWKVWLYDFSTGKRKRILRGGARNALQATDYNYPLLAWSPDNQTVAVLWERRDIARLNMLDLDKGKKTVSDLSPEYQRVYSMDFINPVELLFSAASRGFADLFIYRTVTRQTERITQDFWDDLDASVVTLDGKKSIIFASNRLNDTLSTQRLDTLLPLGKYDIFLYDYEKRNPELVRVTNTPDIDERAPVVIDSTHFAFLSDQNGIINRQAGYLESYIAYHQAVVYLKDGAEAKALDMTQQGEWPLERTLQFLIPLDTLLKNLDSTQIDSIRSFPIEKKRPKTFNLTNLSRNIAGHHATLRAGKMVEYVPAGRKTGLYRRSSDLQPAPPAPPTRYKESQLRAAGLPVPPRPQIPAEKPQSPARPEPMRENPFPRDSGVVVEPGWLFQVPAHLAVPAPAKPAEDATEEVPAAPANPELNTAAVDTAKTAPRKPTKLVQPMLEFGKNGSVLRFNPSQITPYRLKFRTDYISFAPNNDLLFEGLEAYDSLNPGFQQPRMGLLLKGNFKDLLENYVLEAGVRIPVNLGGAEYYMWLDDKKRRIDRRFAIYRRTLSTSYDESGSLPGPPANRRVQIRNTSLLGMYEMSYPLDVFTSFRAAVMLRQDKSDSLSTNISTLESDPRATQRAFLRLSAVYDNTVDVDINLKTGTRAKLYFDVVKRFAFNTRPEWSLKLNEGFMNVIGLDARHYQPVLRHAIFAVRLAAAASFGTEKMLYYLGGVENPLFARDNFNQNIPLPQGGNFAFETQATNLRGFKLNIRNGNSYALLNTELRVPLFKYFSRKPVMGNFWRNFQIAGFLDVGTAWQGKNPYSGDNPLNIVYVSNPPTVFLKVNYFRDPLVAGYGVGLRTTLFGMYLRADYAWGLETKVVQKPMLHVAMGTDF